MSQLYRASRARFNEYAAWANGLHGDPASAAQITAFRWGVRNFGAEQAPRYVMGLAEEAGEMLEAESQEHLEKEAGDVLVCAAQLCTCLRLDLGVILKEAIRAPFWERELPKAVGNIARTVLKGEQKIRGMDVAEDYRRAAAFGIYRLCNAVAGAVQYPDTCFIKRAVAVAERDYIAYPVDGGR